MTQKEKYNELASEVKKFHSDIIEILNTDKYIADLYKGAQVLYSQFIDEPDILLLGINPGAGYFNENKGWRVEKFDPLEKLEYIDYNYTLAAETKIAFDKAGLKAVLETRTVKSNIYYIGTKNTSDLWNLVCALCSKKISDPETAAMDWTKRLVDIIKPKVIICEGVIAFQEFSKAMTGRKKYFHGKTVIKQEICGYTVLAYSRKRDSGIKDIDSLVKMLKETFNYL